MRCFFIGHREAPTELLPKLYAAIEYHITELGVTEFVAGHYGGFDRLAASALQQARSHYPITLTLLLPYHPAERSVELPNGFDGSFYPPGLETTPRRYAIVRANQYMVKHCDCLITYVRHPASNAQKLLEFALRQSRLRITQL